MVYLQYVNIFTLLHRAGVSGRCAHIAAILLMLSKHIDENGYIVEKVSTSLPCSWNKGKKREKKTQKLHNVSYQSNKRQKPDDLYYWDPRPKELRIKNNEEQVNSFICDIQSIYSMKGGNQFCMWQTLLKISYKDFNLSPEDISYYKSMVTIFENHIEEYILELLKDSVSGQIPGTEGQSESSTWFQQRMFRITASKCKTVISLGEKISQSVDERKCFYDWVKNNFWFPSNILTLDMKYGIESESEAVKLYMSSTGKKVISSGLWVNKKYIHLAASPDGLLFNDQNKLHGILEIKCLKIFKNKTIEQLVSEKPSELSRQCFKIVNNKIFLKRTHQYYYQIQMQLLVTEADYCDFILYSNVGKIYVERITKDDDVQSRVKKYTKLFWKKLLIPEYFIMRVPRELLPVLL